MPLLYSVKGHWGGGGAGRLFPLGQTSLYTACLLLFLQIHQAPLQYACGGTPGETCQRSVVLLELGYKVTDQSNRFVRCGVCLAFEFPPLWVSLCRYRFTISVASV